VAIAAALVPPLCVVGFGLGTSDLRIASGSLLLFITNLIAIVFSAAITFLALGFHPARAERGELLRGLKVTIISLGAIFLILAFTTIATVIDSHRISRVSEVFQSSVVARAAQIVEFTIDRDRNNVFVIDALIIDFESNRLTPAEIEIIEAELTEAAGGTVELQAVVIPGSSEILDDLQTERKIQNLLISKMRLANARVIYFETDRGSSLDGYVVDSTVISTEQLSEADIAAIQQEISEESGVPVTLNVTILAGAQVTVQPPTPTPEP
jgi:uncharacterized membrane protein